ncbi:citrulline utilization hydrolase CtlX [Rothia uropygialis]|uniref:citrulline utilization hydrolase CtlX n=1 Tax=Kocuria sp. 36 TaxID=1415402 RepID=UPI001931132F|nr:arginine deiminase-related protein [Kocuria sp. 36]
MTQPVVSETNPSVEVGHPQSHVSSRDTRPQQAPRQIVLVRPHRFTPNPLTELDNRFQSRPTQDPRQVARVAFEEVTSLAEKLEKLGLGVAVFEDLTNETPDSVFPNNWFSTHDDGTVVLYPMHAPNRRAERREDVLAHLRKSGVVRRVVDYSTAESEGQYLEGTGAMVLDHVHRLAYVCRSQRASSHLLARFCSDLGFQPVVFDAFDSRGVPVYHTNVLMSVGTHVTLIGATMIRDPRQRARVLDSLRSTGRQVIELEESQIQRFAGNCLEVSAVGGPTLVLSATAASSLTPQQRRAISVHAHLEPVDVSMIESAGGSVRCMMAGNHLPPRQSKP